MTEQKNPYTVTTSAGGSRATITIDSHGPAPCLSCGGVMATDVTASDLEQCTACGLRRMRPQAKQAAAYTCPVCYAAMDQPPVDHSICGGCGTHFAYDDCGRTHEELRALWIAHGRRWHYLEAAIRKDTQAAATRDTNLLGHYAELLHMLQEMTDVGDAWCADKMAAFERELDHTEKLKGPSV